MDCLKVSSKSSPASVAGAIAGMVKDGVPVNIQCVGAGAVNHGKAWPGFKVVEGRSIRKYTDEADVVQAATAAGYKDIYKKTLIGIGEMEKLMGKEQFRSILGQYVTKPHGKLTLVPESDRREAVTASTAQDDFMEV